MRKSYSEDEVARFIEGIPQLVPESRCLDCKICCRFPDTEHVQTPTWSSQEAGWLQEAVRVRWLKPDAAGPSVRPVLKECGHGFLCPAFDAGSNRCTIYPMRPLDCRLYPFTLCEDASSERLCLAVDLKCPYIQENIEDPKILDYAARLIQYLHKPEAAHYVRMNPAVVGPTWPEFLFIAGLPHLKKAVRRQLDTPSPHPALRPLEGPEGAKQLRKALSFEKHRYSGYTAAGVVGWADIIRYWWAPLEDSLCLFAEQAGGFFMPLPPLGRSPDSKLADQVWAMLMELNGGNEVSRIEGIEAEQKEAWVGFGFHLEAGEPEYLYSRVDIAGLRGDRYRTQRGMINRCLRNAEAWSFRPFRKADLVACLQLYTKWGLYRQQEVPEPFFRALVRDGLFFHRRLMMEGDLLGVTGRVLEKGGRIAGYTFGAEVSADTFCVFLEIADPAVDGVSQLMFREFCREMNSYPFINAMGDSGLSGLRQAKESYHPRELVTPWIARKKKG